MKLDSSYSFIYRCPKTGERVSSSQRAYSNGVCHLCGHDEKSTFTHAEKVVGKWDRPNLLEWLQGDRKTFIPRMS